MTDLPSTRSRPRVAVITRTKNRALLLRRAMESVLDQALTNWVHVIVNDGGVPDAVNLLAAEYEAKYRGRLVVIHNPTSLGMQEASNVGIQAVDSDFVVIHDDDDSWSPGFLFETVQYLDSRPSTQGVVTWTTLIYERINGDQITEVHRGDYTLPPGINLFRMAAENLFAPIAFVYRRSVHAEIGMFDNRFTVLGDWDFNLRFLLRYEIDILPRKLAYYHHRETKGGQQGEYANSVTGGHDDHVAKLHLMQNHYLREDIRHNQVGLGHVMNISRGFLDGSRTADRMLAGQKEQAFQISQLFPFLRPVDQRMHGIYSAAWALRERVKYSVIPKWKRLRMLWNLFTESRTGEANGRIAAPTWLDEAGAKLSQSSVVSFDVFDTVLTRLVERPTDVFRVMEGDARKILGRNDWEFASYRVRAETLARIRKSEESQISEVTLEEIYEELGRLLGDVSKPSLDELKDRELKWEEKLLYVAKVPHSLIKRALGEGKRVIFVSDMYLSAERIRHLLESKGIAGAEVYSSCDQGVTKHSGGLFQRLPALTGIELASLSHVGDNLQSDVEQAGRSGAQGIHWTQDAGGVPYAMRGSRDGQRALSVGGSLTVGLARRHREDLLFSELSQEERLARLVGYEIAGPLFLSFVGGCIRQARADGLGRLLFLARDGYFLEKTFQRIKKSLGLPMEGKYVFASRRLLTIPAIRSLDAETVRYLTKPTALMSLRHYLERTGLKYADYERIVRECGFSDPDEILTTTHFSFRTKEIERNLRALFQRLEGPILENAARERALLEKYVASTGLSTETDAVVDVGWRATNLVALNRFCKKGGPGLTGYYFATWNSAEVADWEGCRLTSWYLDRGLPARRAEIVGECVELVELLFNAPHPTIVGVRANEAGWDPVYGEDELGENEREWLAVMHQAALKFVDDFLEILPDIALEPGMDDYLDRALAAFFLTPTSEEAEILGKFGHRDAFGGNTPVRHLAGMPSRSEQIRHPESLTTAYRHCYWKRGLLAQMNDDQKMYAFKRS